MHIKKYWIMEKEDLHSDISNRDINLSACRLLLLAVVRPTL